MSARILKCPRGSQDVRKDPGLMSEKILKCPQGSWNVSNDPEMSGKILRCQQGSLDVSKDPRLASTDQSQLGRHCKTFVILNSSSSSSFRWYLDSYCGKYSYCRGLFRDWHIFSCLTSSSCMRFIQLGGKSSGHVSFSTFKGLFT